MAHENRRLVRLLLSLFACGILLPSVQALAQGGAAADVDRAFERATQSHQAGNLEEAVRGYRAILASHPYRADVRSNLGAAYSRLGRYEEAIEQYKRALANDSHNQTIRFNLALAYYKAAWFTEAASELNQFLTSAPKDLSERQTAILLLADSQVRLGEYKKVIELLSPLEGIGANNRTVAYLLG